MEIDQVAIAKGFSGALARWAGPSSDPKADANGVRIRYGRDSGEQKHKIRLSFDTPDHFGIAVVIEVKEFAAYPDGYSRKILGGVKRRIDEARKDRQDAQSPIILPAGVTV